MKKFIIGTDDLNLDEINNFVFNRSAYSGIEITKECREKVEKSHRDFLSLLEEKLPIYGVTTGFGDSCVRSIPNEKSEELQSNLISYLLCGTGAVLPQDASRAVVLIRLNSLSRGYSGISFELLERMQLFLEKDWLPVIPREGSLGASGDLVPLAYLAQALQGEGKIYVRDQILPTAQVLKEAGVKPYTLKAKEGLALVNGTTTMAGLSLVNLNEARFLVDIACATSGWLCLSLKGRTEAFGTLINEIAKKFPGQKLAAQKIRKVIEDESYSNKPLKEISIQQNKIQEQIQDRYSLRCAPQILGPVIDTLDQFSEWLELEINGVSDNPLIDSEKKLQMGGNFYGGYLSHGMDYLKICVAQVADMMDRQLMTLIDEKSNRGLPANLAAWDQIPKEDHFLHHGLKGLHQAASAITSEIMSKAMPNSIFSRSSESHNQDKVSLGMSAAVQCYQMMDQMYTVTSLYLICLAQALDIRKIELQGAASQKLYDVVRRVVPFVERDKSLDQAVENLNLTLKEWSKKGFGELNEKA